VLPDHVGRQAVEKHVYKLVELVGSSDNSIEEAIKSAVDRASKTLRNLRWFEVVQTRGHIEGGTVRHYQVVIKAGFTLEEGEED
jgi:flavin-binding protein dodecin